MIHRTDYVESALDRLPEQFKNSENFKKLITVLVKQLQQVEDAVYSMRNLFDIDNSEGAQLDLLGKILGAPRAGRDDTRYKLRLKGQQLIFFSGGESERIRKVLELCVPGSNPNVQDNGEAAFLATMAQVTISDPLETALLVRETKSAGVSGYVYWQTANDANTFCFDTGPGLGYDVGEYSGILA